MLKKFLHKIEKSYEILRSFTLPQYDKNTCPPLAGGPKSLISRRGSKTLTRISKFTSFIKKFNPQLTHTDSHTSPQLSGSLCITVREGEN